MNFKTIPFSQKHNICLCAGRKIRKELGKTTFEKKSL